MHRFFLAMLVILALGVAANAQTFRGAINGTVTDPSGGVVPNAQVKATEAATGIDHATVTTSEGQFAFQDIPLGLYKVAVTATGFPPYTIDRVEVVAGTIYTLNIRLSLQQQATTVEVSAAALTLDTTTQTQNMTLTSDIVQNVPLNGRDFTQLISVEPGFGGYNVGGFGSLNGTRANQINWQIDGVDNNDFWHNIPAVNQGGVSGIAGVVLPIDSIEEFSAQTQSGSEAGRNAGGTVNLVTKSGGNDIHGSAYYYNRNEFYGAGSPFLPKGTKTPRLRNENYGFSVGGPIIKNKTFYFASYEKQDFIIGLSGLATEPSDAWIAKAQAVLTAHGVAPSTLSRNLIGPNGFWPRSVIGGLPATLGNFFSTIAETGYSYNGVARVDHQFSDKHHLYLRWFGGQGNQTAPLGGSPALGTASSNLKDYFEVAPIHVFNYSAVFNSSLTTKLTNQVLFGANYFNQIFHDFNNSFNTKSMGLFLSPDATNNGQYILGAPNIVIGPKGGVFEQIGLTPPEGRNDLTWHITDIISHNVGAHQLRYGAEVRQAHLNEFYHRRGTGKFTFDGTQGPWASDPNVDIGTKSLADFLAGDVASSTIAVGNPERFVVVNAFNLYFQDGWQVNRKLNLNFGLRYEYFGPLHSDRKDIANFIPGTGFYVQDGKSLFSPGKNHFAPRIGFAYQPTGRNDLVVRGGIGVFYDQINLNPFLDFRPPINAPQGIEGNPFGSSPVSTYSRNTYNWQTVQAGGASIFPGVQPCIDPNCAAPKDPKGLGAYSVSPNFRTPYFFNFNMQVEKAFGSFAVFQIGYVGSQGRKLNLVSNINQGGAFPNFGNILQLNTIGTSNYNSLQTVFRIRSWRGLTSQFAYTWSHALDEISQYRAAIVDDAFNPKLDYGNGDFDTRHLFTISATYDIPKASWATGAWSSRAVNGWQLASVMNFHAGQPSDENRLGLDLIGDPYKGISHNFDRTFGTQWWNPAAFAVPVSGIGNLARNKFYGPGFGSVDFSVIKNLPVTERVKIQLRADMFNLFNRINLASGVGSVGSSCGTTIPGAHCNTSAGFGQVTDTIGDFNGAPGLGPGEAFNLQLVAKIIF
jgi:Carboxypeptidase regulatory-like domain